MTNSSFTVVEIQHHNTINNSIVLINWCLGNMCNYSCSYCPESLHSGSIRWVDYNSALRFCKKLIDHYKSLNQNIEFLFTGGEPTLYPSFTKLLKELKKENCVNAVITNGSRTIQWWESHISLFDKVVLTYHHEFADKNHIIKLINLIAHQVDVHINITMLPNHFQECIEIAGELNARQRNISITLKPLLKDFGDQLYDYDASQLDILKNTRYKSIKKNTQSRGQMVKVFSDDNKQFCKAADLIVHNENHWKDWRCSIGLELLYIDANGDVYRGTCKQGGKIANIHTSEEFFFPTSHVICKKTTCHCITDIMTSKTNKI